MASRNPRFFSLIAGLLLFTTACGAGAAPPVTYDVGDDWTRGAEKIRLGTSSFELATYGRSRCANVDHPEGVLGTGLVPGPPDVDVTLTKILREGVLPKLFGPRSTAFGGVPRDVPAGRGARIFVAEDGCVPFDPMARLVELDVRGYPVHDPDGVAVFFLAGTFPVDLRDRILASVRVTG